MQMNSMGIDIGTTGCKAAVFNENGRMLSFAYREYPTVTPRPGWAGLDSAKVINACFAVIKEAAAAVDGKVQALAISSQGEAFTPIASDGKFLHNAIVSFDTRAAEIAESWSAKFGKDELYRITGHTAHPMFTVFKLLWLRDNQPEIWSKTNKFLCFEDLLQFKLGVEPCMGWPLAGRTMMFDVTAGKWSSRILEEVGISAAQMADPQPSGTIAGTIPADIAAGLGLKGEVIVVCGGHDQSIGALGAGVVREGRAMYATGTVECITPAFSTPVFSDSLMNNNLCTYNYSLKDMFTTVAFCLTGGNILKWFRDEFGYQELEEARQSGADVYECILSKMDSKPTELFTLPYFTPTGTPFFDANASGAILGLKLTTKRSEILRSLLEGVAMEMRLNLEILEKSGCVINELMAVGGGARSKALTQLKADVLNKPITTVEVSEAGCLGAAALAFSARNGDTKVSCIEQWVKPQLVISPSAENAAIYDSKFDIYKRLYPATRDLFS